MTTPAERAEQWARHRLGTGKKPPTSTPVERAEEWATLGRPAHWSEEYAAKIHANVVKAMAEPARHFDHDYASHFDEDSPRDDCSGSMTEAEYQEWKGTP